MPNDITPEKICELAGHNFAGTKTCKRCGETR